jgi:hypothetical protein
MQRARCGRRRRAGGKKAWRIVEGRAMKIAAADEARERLVLKARVEWATD